MSRDPRRDECTICTAVASPGVGGTGRQELEIRGPRRSGANRELTFKALLITKVEALIEDYWATVQLDPTLRRDVEAALRTERGGCTQETEAEQRQLHGSVQPS
jgi:hypothetical protein